MRRRDTGQLRRRRPFLDPRPRVLVFAEGKKTETGYFKEFVSRERNPLIRLEIDGGGVPKTLVERAARAVKEGRRDRSRAYDEVWCVYDEDEHPKLKEAEQQARDNRIHLAVSLPCFELWLLLHFESQNAQIERDEVKRRCKVHLPSYEKEVPFGVVAPHYDDAVRRARELDAWQEGRGCAGQNPTTRVYLLTERLLELRRAEQLKRERGSIPRR